MRARRFFWGVGTLRALIESWVLGALLMIGLLLVGEQIPPNALGQSFFFLGVVCALWCALRLRLPEGVAEHATSADITQVRLQVQSAG